MKKILIILFAFIATQVAAQVDIPHEDSSFVKTQNGWVSPSVLGGGSSSSSSTKLPDNYVLVPIILGQSNAQGYALNTAATTAEKAANGAVYIYNSTSTDWEVLNIGTNNKGATSSRHGIELAIKNHYTDYFNVDSVFIIKDAYGGTAISEHIEGAGLYTAAWHKSIFPALEKLIERGRIPYVQVYWLQGESDATQALSMAYLDKFISWKESVRNNLGLDVPIISFQTNESTYYREIVNQSLIQAVTADPNADYVLTNDLTAPDGSHYPYDEIKTIGLRMMERFTTLPNIATTIQHPPPFYVQGEDTTNLNAYTTTVDYSRFKDWKGAHEITTINGSKALRIVGSTGGCCAVGSGRGGVSFKIDSTKSHFQSIEFDYYATSGNKGGVMLRMSEGTTEVKGYYFQISNNSAPSDQNIIRLYRGLSGLLDFASFTVNTSTVYRFRAAISEQDLTLDYWNGSSWTNLITKTDPQHINKTGQVGFISGGGGSPVNNLYFDNVILRY